MSLENTSMQYHQEIRTALLKEFRKASKVNRAYEVDSQLVASDEETSLITNNDSLVF